MTLDAYALCPGGTGKKIKHCGCRGIVGELDKIAKALAGNQRVAALDRINRVLATNANRPCLLAMKATALLDMGELQELEDTVTTFLQAAPENVSAHTFATFLELRKNNLSEAVSTLQKALSLATNKFPYELYEALGAVGRSLALRGSYVAARGHLLLRAMVGGKDDEEALTPLFEISRVDGVPAPLKQDFVYLLCPDDVPWRDRFLAAVTSASHGAWKNAGDQFEALDKEIPRQPSILKNLAIVRCYLADPKGADAWHQYAALDAVPFDEAVDAETLAQTIEFEANQKTVDLVCVTFNVSDANELQARLLSCDVLVSDTADLSEFRAKNLPPPKSTFHLLNRPKLVSDASFELDEVPAVLGRILLFGRETDREARLEFVLTKNCNYERARTALAEIAGELVDEGSEEVLNTVGIFDAELFPILQFPEDTTFPKRSQLMEERMRRAFHERWTKISLAELDGKTPEQVVDDPAYRVRLAAAILALEQIAEAKHWSVDGNALRAKLGVPLLESIDVNATNYEVLAPAHWSRVEFDKLSDEQLLNFFQRIGALNLKAASLKAGKELLQRDSLGDKVDKANLCRHLAELSQDTDESLTYLQKAMEVFEAEGKSPACWLLAQLPLRLLRGDVAQAQDLLDRIQTHHINEPGVGEALYKTLAQFGLVSPDGADAKPTAEESPQQPDGKIWKPGDPEPQSGDDKESKLWLPGMD